VSKKAVDVVLLPAQAMIERAIEVNRELVEKAGEKIVLNKEKCFPHISLAMGCIEEDSIAAIERILKEIAGKAAPTKLKVTGIQTTENAAGDKVSSFEIENTRRLQLLHEQVMQKLEPYLGCDVRADMLFDPDQVSESTLLWIRNYREESSFTNFRPHITVGYGEPDDPSLSFEFEASELSLCHLGNHCTCRKILVSIELATQP